jgi:hypothetical protein
LASSGRFYYRSSQVAAADFYGKPSHSDVASKVFGAVCTVGIAKKKKKNFALLSSSLASLFLRPYKKKLPE